MKMSEYARWEKFLVSSIEELKCWTNRTEPYHEQLRDTNDYKHNINVTNL